MNNLCIISGFVPLSTVSCDQQSGFLDLQTPPFLPFLLICFLVYPDRVTDKQCVADRREGLNLSYEQIPISSVISLQLSAVRLVTCQKASAIARELPPIHARCAHTQGADMYRNMHSDRGRWTNQYQCFHFRQAAFIWDVVFSLF